MGWLGYSPSFVNASPTHTRSRLAADCLLSASLGALASPQPQHPHYFHPSAQPSPLAPLPFLCLEAPMAMPLVQLTSDHTCLPGPWRPHLVNRDTGATLRDGGGPLSPLPCALAPR